MEKKESAWIFKKSRFILARQGEMNERQKAAVLALVEREMLGEVILTPESAEEEITHFVEREELPDETAAKLREALQEGKNIYSGWVSAEKSLNGFEELMDAVWDILEENSD